jgi:hypothetical protein
MELRLDCFQFLSEEAPVRIRIKRGPSGPTLFEQHLHPRRDLFFRAPSALAEFVGREFLIELHQYEPKPVDRTLDPLVRTVAFEMAKADGDRPASRDDVPIHWLQRAVVAVDIMREEASKP